MEEKQQKMEPEIHHYLELVEGKNQQEGWEKASRKCTGTEAQRMKYFKNKVIVPNTKRWGRVRIFGLDKIQTTGDLEYSSQQSDVDKGPIEMS